MIFDQKQHEKFMQQALVQAEKAFKSKEIPIGAVVVNEHGSIIGRAHNRVEAQLTQAAHAEILALTKASKKIGNWRLEHCWLYVTLEPCAMCINLVLLSRLAGVVFGAPSPLFGYSLDKNPHLPLYKGDIAVIPGIGDKQSAALLKKFFNIRRKSRG